MRSEDFVATPKRLLNLGKRDARYTYTCIVPYYHYLLILDYTYPFLVHSAQSNVKLSHRCIFMILQMHFEIMYDATQMLHTDVLTYLRDGAGFSNPGGLSIIWWA